MSLCRTRPTYRADRFGRLQVEVQREPIIALDGGDDGLKPFRRLLAQAKDKVAPVAESWSSS